MGLMYFLYFAMAWHAFWLLAMVGIWYRYDVHPVLRKFWYRTQSRLRRLHQRLCT